MFFFKKNASNEILNKLYNQFSENLVLNNEEKMIEALKEFKQIMLEETCTDFVNTEVFVSGFYKHLIGLLDSNFNKNHNLLSEVLWILINLSCVTDEEKLNMLFREKLITKLINLIKIDENSPLTDDVLLFTSSKFCFITFCCFFRFYGVSPTPFRSLKRRNMISSMKELWRSA
jgi:hypothetical protein